MCWRSVLWRWLVSKLNNVSSLINIKTFTELFDHPSYIYIHIHHQACTLSLLVIIFSWITIIFFLLLRSVAINIYFVQNRLIKAESNYLRTMYVWFLIPWSFQLPGKSVKFDLYSRDSGKYKYLVLKRDHCYMIGSLKYRKLGT